jgi:threonine/homoserine/homoserine lactone efflux protein
VTTALLGFALASTLVILAPGPDSMLVMRNTMRGGRRAGWVTACGTLSGLTIWALAAALGLSALLRVSNVGYDILRFCGAAYLIWLGVTSLAHFRRRKIAAELVTQPGGSDAAALGLTGPGTARPRRA